MLNFLSKLFVRHPAATAAENRSDGRCLCDLCRTAEHLVPFDPTVMYRDQAIAQLQYMVEFLRTVPVDAKFETLVFGPSHDCENGQRPKVDVPYGTLCEMFPNRIARVFCADSGYVNVSLHVNGVERGLVRSEVLANRPGRSKVRFEVRHRFGVAAGRRGHDRTRGDRVQMTNCHDILTEVARNAWRRGFNFWFPLGMLAGAVLCESVNRLLEWWK